MSLISVSNILRLYITSGNINKNLILNVTPASYIILLINLYNNTK